MKTRELREFVRDVCESRGVTGLPVAGYCDFARRLAAGRHSRSGIGSGQGARVLFARYQARGLNHRVLGGIARGLRPEPPEPKARA